MKNVKAPPSDKKGRGKGNASATKATDADLIWRMVALVVDSQRRLGQLEDRICTVLIIYDELIKEKINIVREHWRTQNKEREGQFKARRDAFDKAKEAEAEEDDDLDDEDNGSLKRKLARRAKKKELGAAPGTPGAAGDQPAEAPAQSQPSQQAEGEKETDMNVDSKAPQVSQHPMGGGLRSVIFKAAVLQFGASVPHDHKCRGAVDSLNKWSVPNLELAIFRAKPLHQKPKVGAPWVWSFMFKESIDEDSAVEKEFKNALRQMRQQPHLVQGLKFADQHSIDGAYTKYLSAWSTSQRETKGGGKSGGRPRGSD